MFGYRLATYRFMHVNQKFYERGQTKIELFGVISKGLYENETFLKTYVNGEFDFIKRPEKA